MTSVQICWIFDRYLIRHLGVSSQVRRLALNPSCCCQGKCCPGNQEGPGRLIFWLSIPEHSYKYHRSDGFLPRSLKRRLDGLWEWFPQLLMLKTVWSTAVVWKTQVIFFNTPGLLSELRVRDFGSAVVMDHLDGGWNSPRPLATKVLLVFLQNPRVEDLGLKMIFSFWLQLCNLTSVANN